MALVSGKTGYVNVAGTPYRFAKWSLPLSCNTPKVNNFVDAPYEVYVAGLLGAKLTATGPYDVGNMPLTIGSTYVFVLGVTNAVFLTVTAILNALTPTNDVDGNPAVEIGAQVSGPFSGQIV